MASFSYPKAIYTPCILLKLFYLVHAINTLFKYHDMIKIIIYQIFGYYNYDNLKI